MTKTDYVKAKESGDGSIDSYFNRIVILFTLQLEIEYVKS